MSQSSQPWYRELNRYHWFVFTVAALGWLFDTMDQQLFNLARTPAMRELLTPEMKPNEKMYAAIVTSIFLVGWATGGLIFGVLGDRIGRARTMLLTILLYSICTGLSAFSTNVWDFAAYRFITGLGVGGEFAVGVALVAEAMPSRARPFALALLQALSAVGNITASVVSIGLGHLEQEELLLHLPKIAGFALTPWRLMFLIGTLPALLAIVIRRRLKEPEQWKAVADHTAAKQLGSYRELLGDPRWRRRALVGMVLAGSGVIGVWGIGFFSPDLNRSLFRKQFEAEARERGEAVLDRDFVLLAIRSPAEAAKLEPRPRKDQLLSLVMTNDAGALFDAAMRLHGEKKQVTVDELLLLLDQPSAGVQSQTTMERERRRAYLVGEPAAGMTIPQHAARIAARNADIDGRLTRWGGYTLLMFHIGGFFGMYGFGMLTYRVGRRPAFAVSFLAAMFATAAVFAGIQTPGDVLWMMPILGLCQMTLFGGYAIYFPELFPTRLRSTGTSFAYNVGRFVAALGPLFLGALATGVFQHHAEPLRWACVSMSAVYLIGLAALPFAPETRGQPLPE